jgi:glycosyltransferase involved in cell wall biosynthesis
MDQGSLMRGTILLISQTFPPRPIVGALRAANVARAFADGGYRVIVVTAAMEGEPASVREWERGIMVHAVAVGTRHRERLTRFVRRLQSIVPRRAGRPGAPESGRPPDTGAASEPGAAGSTGLRALLLSLVWIPDDELRFVLPAYRTARRLLREGVDLVYTSAPSHSTNLVGLLLKRLHKIPWTAEFRDPWCYPNGARLSPSIERLNQNLERRCIIAADHLVTVTDQAADLYRARLGGSAAKVVVVRNGIPAVLTRPERRAGDPFRIVYSGSLYGGRDPREFLRASAEVWRECASTGTPLAVDIFVGEGRAAGDVPLDDYIVQHGMEGFVRVHEWVPHPEIQRVLQNADLLLLLAQHQPLQVPNKLYEYLGTGVPILAIADDEGETARMLRQVGGHYIVSDDCAAAIAAALREAMGRQHLPSAAGATEVLEEWLTERQMRLLVAAVRP